MPKTPNMKNRTYHNVLKSTKIIADKGYDWDTANKIALKCWDNYEMYGGTVTIESLLARVVPRNQFEREQRDGRSMFAK